MEIIQVVGYKNSGKTTTATVLIEALAKKGVQVASLKHHGHGGIPLGIENTDSGRHKQAGAIISGVEGEGVLQLTNQNAWTLEQMIALYKIMNIDVLIIEGFKKENYRKVVLINTEEDFSLLSEVNHILAVITSIPLKKEFPLYPTFERHHLQELCKWLINNHLAIVSEKGLI